ncbi:sugar porter family MFS transporter [Vibrio sp. EA2]|uniref:sugar porter family MFS transporter n=1 Tax=Vibrio sp. EA2 TaxID=3079860 RepID=UPI002949BC4E|nr:sugar porter family MFS transporter [Vibrio sp. EA2]MDV6254378.1 sugar porter family MFS transporter [Vibrio sp. EA2]
MSNETTLNPKANIAYILKICCVAALGGILFGYDTAVISGAIGPIQEYFGLDATEKGWAVSSVVLGSIVGAFSAGTCSLRFGRRRTLLLAAVLFAISAIGSALAQDFTFYTLLRIVGGLAVGLAAVVSPMYISEVAPSAFRGRAVSMFQQSIVVGQCVVFYINFLIARGMTEAWLQDMGWRWMLGSETIPALLFFVLLFTIPESPRWLVLKDQVDKARDVLTRISGKADAEEIIVEIQKSLVASNSKSDKKVSLRSPLMFSIVAVGTFVAAAQQFTGINVIMYYSPEILKPIAGGTENALFQTTFIGLVFIFGNALGMYLIDRMGRLPLMIWGTLGCAISMTIVGFVMYNQATGYTALFALCLYVISYATSWGCVCWTLISEIFPNAIRSRAMSIAVAAQWIAGFMVAQGFPMLNNNEYLNEMFHGGFAFWLFAGLSIISMLLVVKYVPETKGVKLEEMEKVMATKLGKHKALAQAKA